jgi:hypothetical protein
VIQRLGGSPAKLPSTRADGGAWPQDSKERGEIQGTWIILALPLARLRAWHATRNWYIVGVPMVVLVLKKVNDQS